MTELPLQLPVKNGVLILAKLFVVGIGPGEYEQMTIKAVNTIKNCPVIAGYTVYCDLIKKYFPEKEYISSAMKKEKDRCRLAFESAENKDTALICSGDAGVYALAGLAIEMSKEYPSVRLDIVPGVTAALSGGALLGAPLGHDFALISLSDLLTPLDLIKKRIRLASEGDFAICIYNPSSIKRAEYLKTACEIMLEFKDKNTVCAVVKNIGRDGEEKKIMTLEELKDYKADMFTTVFVGNSKTYVVNGFMVTPRGYVI